VAEPCVVNREVGALKTSTIRILLVDDFKPWREFIRSMLSGLSHFRFIAEAFDGEAAVISAHELQPDLVLLDVGLPSLNGIEACRQIRKLSPQSKILFISEHRSPDVVAEAMRAGGSGYVVKSYAGKDLLRAIVEVVEGGRFVSILDDLPNVVNPQRNNDLASRRVDARLRMTSSETEGHHHLSIYGGDEALVDGFASFAKCALTNQNPVIVAATARHRAAIARRLKDNELDLETAIEQGLYIEADACDLLSRIMIGNLPSADRIEEVVNDFIARTANATTEHSTIALCGELAPTLLTEGNAEAAILLENQVDELVRSRALKILCGYVGEKLLNAGSKDFAQELYSAHSSVYRS